MKKKNSRSLCTVLLISLMMAVTLVFSGCGGEPETLEDYVNSKEEVQEQIDSLSSTSAGGGGMTVEINGNTVEYVYQYSQTFDDAAIAQMVPQFESYMASAGSTFSSIADSLEEQSGISGVIVKVSYLNGDGSEIFSQEY